MPSARGQPLHVARAEARRRAERIGVVDEAPPDDGHGLEAAMRVLREAGHDGAVVHAPAVLAREVLADVAPRERRRGPEALVARRVGVVVMHAEEERVGRLPRRPRERADLEDRVRGGGRRRWAPGPWRRGQSRGLRDWREERSRQRV